MLNFRQFLFFVARPCHLDFLDLFFSFVPPPPSLVGAYYLQPPDARAIFLHNDLLCNDTCSVTGGSITYYGGGAQTEKIRFFDNCLQRIFISIG